MFSKDEEDYTLAIFRLSFAGSRMPETLCVHIHVD